MARPRSKEHGTYRAYVQAKCRCPECVEWSRENQRKGRARARERLAAGVAKMKHGSSATYLAGCRCDVCVAAQAVRTREKQQEAYRRSLETARHYGDQWTGPELEVLANHPGTVAEIATLLGRTTNAVVWQRRALYCDPRKDRLAGVPRRTKNDNKKEA